MLVSNVLVDLSHCRMLMCSACSQRTLSGLYLNISISRYRLRVTGVTASVRCKQIGQHDGLCHVLYFCLNGIFNMVCAFSWQVSLNPNDKWTHRTACILTTQDKPENTSACHYMTARCSGYCLCPCIQALHVFGATCMHT